VDPADKGRKMALLKKKTPVERITEEVTRQVKSHPGTAAVAGLAAAAALGAAAWITSRRSAERDGIALHVESDGDGTWLLRQEGRDEPLERRESKRSTVSVAREYARQHSPAALTIHKQKGGVSRRHIYAGG
jgi:hypothetical protein